MPAHRLDPLLHPQSIAVVGASERAGSVGLETLLNLRNATRLNQQIQDRIHPEAWAEDGGNATDVDLLIDRLHDISDP